MLPSLAPRRFAIALPLSPLAERLQLAVGPAVLLRRLHRIEPRPADRTPAFHAPNDNGGGYHVSRAPSRRLRSMKAVRASTGIRRLRQIFRLSISPVSTSSYRTLRARLRRRAASSGVSRSVRPPASRAIRATAPPPGRP